MAVTAKELRDLARIVVLCMFWYIVGSSNGVLGKWILSEFPYPMTLTMCQVRLQLHTHFKSAFFHVIFFAACLHSPLLWAHADPDGC